MNTRGRKDVRRETRKGRLATALVQYVVRFLTGDGADCAYNPIFSPSAWPLPAPKERLTSIRFFDIVCCNFARVHVLLR